jgi:hypothetical protein
MTYLESMERERSAESHTVHTSHFLEPRSIPSFLVNSLIQSCNIPSTDEVKSLERFILWTVGSLKKFTHSRTNQEEYANHAHVLVTFVTIRSLCRVPSGFLCSNHNHLPHLQYTRGKKKDNQDAQPACQTRQPQRTRHAAHFALRFLSVD